MATCLAGCGKRQQRDITVMVMGGCRLGSTASKRAGPLTRVSHVTTVCMACSGFTHGPPLDDQPAQLWKHKLHIQSLRLGRRMVE